MAERNNPLTASNRRRLAEFYRQRDVVKVVEIPKHKRTIYQRRPKLVKVLDSLYEIQLQIDAIAESEHVVYVAEELEQISESVNRAKRRAKRQ